MSSSTEAKLGPHHCGMKEGTPCRGVPDTRRIGVSKAGVPAGGLQGGDGQVVGCRGWPQIKGQFEMSGQLPIGAGVLTAPGAPGLKQRQHTRLDLTRRGLVTVARHDEAQEEKVGVLQGQGKGGRISCC